MDTKDVSCGYLKVSVSIWDFLTVAKSEEKNDKILGSHGRWLVRDEVSGAMRVGTFNSNLFLFRKLVRGLKRQNVFENG